MTWLSALLLSSVFLAGCGAKHENAQGEASNLPVATVQVQTIESRPQVSTEAVVGTVQAKRHATLEAKVIGHIEQLPIALGQPVKAGELVALLASSDLKARLDQAEASQEQADATGTGSRHCSISRPPRAPSSMMRRPKSAAPRPRSPKPEPCWLMRKSLRPSMAW